MDKDNATNPPAEDSKNMESIQKLEPILTKNTSSKKVEFPFDLNNLFSMQINYNYNFDTLK